MRIARFLVLLLAAAVAAAGCARRPPAPVAVAVESPPPPPGIDNVIYGPAGTQAVPVVAAPFPAAVAVPAGGVVVPPLAYAPALLEGAYTLDSGDRLRIVVFGQEGLTNSYAVDASGHIAMPLIGSVSARGLTTDELSRRIADKLRQGFIREPHVAVEIEAYRPFFILGEVAYPGQYPYVANMTVETAVAIAGGFAPRAFRQTAIVTRFVNGEQVRMTVPVTCPIRPGDTVNVQERWF
jgi:polysaccharide biosynthesis/export protein